MSEEANIIQAMAATLLGSGFFDDVYTTGLPKLDDQSAEDLRAVAIMPMSGTESDQYDAPTAGYQCEDAQVKFVFVVRAKDEAVRDRTVSLLFNYARNALNGQSIAGLTLPQWTKFTSHKWEDPAPPERKITATFQYRYLVQGWTSFATDP